MAKFCNIIGQEHIKEHLQNAIINDTVSHAYILNGDKGSGKEFIANTFAMALQCEKGETEPCMECSSCKQAITKNHPDIKTIIHEKPNMIGVDDIRGQLINDVMIKPYNSKWKVYIMNECEKMTVQAQNALLKTLEEPPKYVVILLLTSNVSALLDTIVSRATVLNMRPVEDKLVRRYLMDTLHLPDYQADICVAFARGNIGQAKSLATSEDFDVIKQEALTVLKYIRDMDLISLSATIKKLSEYKMNIYDYLDIMMIWYRDVLMMKATNDANDLVFKEEIKYIRESASLSTYEGIEEIIHAIDKAKSRLYANVNFDLVLELLLLTIKEN